MGSTFIVDYGVIGGGGKRQWEGKGQGRLGKGNNKALYVHVP